MPAVSRVRNVRSLSPSLIPSISHRFVPYSRSSQSPASTDSETSSISSGCSCSCDRLRSLNLSGSSISPSPERERPRLPPISSFSPPRRPTHSIHRRAVSTSSISAGYIVFPQHHRPPHIRVPTHFHPTHVPTLHHPIPRMANRQPRPAPIRIASPPLTPIQESALPKPKSRNEKLMLVTPSMAAYLKQGKSVSIKGPDGRSWKIRAPIRSPVCAMRT